MDNFDPNQLSPHGERHRLDPSKVEDLQILVNTGLIWREVIPVEYKTMALDALVTGTVTVTADVLADIPQDALDEVERRRNNEGLPPLTALGEPAEQLGPLPGEGNTEEVLPLADEEGEPSA